MGSYKRLSLEERDEIALLLSHGWSYGDIASSLNRATSTISREVKRNSNHWTQYRACLAQKRTQRRWRRRVHKLATNRRLRKWVFKHIRWYWSPEQIAATLKQTFPDDPSMQVSHETIYTYLYVLPRGTLRTSLLKCLGKQHMQRRSAKANRPGGGYVTDMLSIEERPVEVANRTIPGHWESDLIMGSMNRSALGTLVERTTRTVILVPLKSKTAADVRKAIARQMKTLPAQMRLSITHDQGIEMKEHKLFTKKTRIKVYFAHPHSPWERGTSENTNGLLRQFFPKGIDFNEVSYYRIKRVQRLMNERPRKVLGWKTPCQAMSELLQ